MKQAMIVGWVLALVAGGAAVLEFLYYQGHEKSALEAQAADYEARMAQVRADAAAAIKTEQDNATAEKLILQTELEFQKLPELPLKMMFRTGGVLFVDNQENAESFFCKVRLSRKGSPTTKELDFSIKPKTFQDVGAIDDWLFAPGDKVEFVKPGYKPKTLVVP